LPLFFYAVLLQSGRTDSAWRGFPNPKRLDRARMNALDCEQRRGGVSKVVETMVPYTRSLKQSLEAVSNSGSIEWIAKPRKKYKNRRFLFVNPRKSEREFAMLSPQAAVPQTAEPCVLRGRLK